MSGANASPIGRSHQEMTPVTFQVWRGSRGEGQFAKYTTEISEGMVVLDAIHKIQAEQANDLGVRFHSEYENKTAVDSAMNPPGQVSSPRANSNSTSRVANQPDNAFKFKLDMKFKIAEMIYHGNLEY